MGLINKIKEWYLTTHIKEGSVIVQQTVTRLSASCYKRNYERYFISQLTKECILKRNSPKGYYLTRIYKHYCESNNGKLILVLVKSRMKNFYTIQELSEDIIKGKAVYYKTPKEYHSIKLQNYEEYNNMD